MNSHYILEICTYSVEGSIAAQAGGAHRVELCDNLPEGGTTPSAATIALARKHLTIDLHIMIRPRGGDFYYSTIEFETMAKDIEVAKSLGANGVVLGILLPDGTVDIRRTQKLVALARPMSVTFHRSFDMTRDPISALEDIICCGADRILTSGQKNSAPDSVEILKELIDRAGERIVIMPGSGINDQTVLILVNATGAKEFHMSAKKKIDGSMKFRKSGISMAGIKDIDEYHRWVTDGEQVRKVAQILARIKS
jgi:copper homeostasis protein